MNHKQNATRPHALAIATLLFLALAALTPSLAQESLEMTVYFSATCDTCHLVEEQVLPRVLEGYGDRVRLTYVDISTAEGLRQLEGVEARLGRPNSPLPVFVAEDTFIADEDIFGLEDALSDYLEERLGPAGTPATVPAQAAAETPAPTAAPAVPDPATEAAIHVAYVDKEGCDQCARAAIVLELMQSEFPGLVVSRFDSMSDGALIEAMGERLGLPEARRLIAPSVYVGEDALVGEEITSDRVRQLLARYAGRGAEAFWKDLNSDSGARSILERFQTMGPLAVVLAGLIDGVNPCAFATILFFVSYLAISRRQRRELLLIGLAFTAGVFLAYLLVGLGAMRLLQWASAMRVIGLILYGLLALSCFVLAGISLYDYRLARQGRLHDMRLNLPDPLRERIKGRIRKGSGAFVGAAFVSGLIVSVLELACTGQVYLPTISFVVGIPSMRPYAVAYLVLYNVVFVLPLLAVLLLAVYGVSAARFQDWFVQHAATAKLVMVCLFLLLGLLLLSQALSL